VASPGKNSSSGFSDAEGAASADELGAVLAFTLGSLGWCTATGKGGGNARC
jgi:hypothetical protein